MNRSDAPGRTIAGIAVEMQALVERKEAEMHVRVARLAWEAARNGGTRRAIREAAEELEFWTNKSAMSAARS